jgi:hypothetical protein
MNRSISILAGVIVFALGAAAVVADTSDRPEGVAASEWVPVSERLGLVIVAGPRQVNARPVQGLYLLPPINGYFMVKAGGRWSRLNLVVPPKGPGATG